jgi:hypothetical protein
MRKPHNLIIPFNVYLSPRIRLFFFGFHLAVLRKDAVEAQILCLVDGKNYQRERVGYVGKDDPKLPGSLL